MAGKDREKKSGANGQRGLPLIPLQAIGFPRREALEHAGLYPDFGPDRQTLEQARTGDQGYRGLSPVFRQQYREALNRWTFHAVDSRIIQDEYKATFDKYIGPILGVKREGDEVEPITQERDLTSILLQLNNRAKKIGLAGKTNTQGFDITHFPAVQQAVHEALSNAQASQFPEVLHSLLNLATMPKPQAIDAGQYSRPDETASIVSSVRTVLEVYLERHLGELLRHISDVVPAAADRNQFPVKDFVGLPTILIGVAFVQRFAKMQPSSFSTMIARGLIPNLPFDVRAALIQEQENLFNRDTQSKVFATLTDAQGGHPYQYLNASYGSAAATELLRESGAYGLEIIDKKRLREDLKHVQFGDMVRELRRSSGSNTLILVQQMGDIIISAYPSLRSDKLGEEQVIQLLLRKGANAVLLAVGEYGSLEGLPIGLGQYPTGFIRDCLITLHAQSFPKREKSSGPQQLAQAGGRRTGPAAPANLSERQMGASSANVTINSASLINLHGLTAEQRSVIDGALRGKQIRADRVQYEDVEEVNRRKRTRCFIFVEGVRVFLKGIKGDSTKFELDVSEFNREQGKKK